MYFLHVFDITQFNTNMKKIFLFAMLMFVGTIAIAQSYVYNEEKNLTAEKQYYIYNIVSITGNIKSEGIKVDVDNGQTVDKLKDRDGKKMTFKTPAAVLMYYLSEGWEIYVSGSSMSGSTASGFGSVTTAPYWIMRKPCSKEEFEATVKNGIK